MNWYGLGVVDSSDSSGARCIPLTDVGESLEAHVTRDRWRRPLLRPHRWFTESPYRVALDCEQAERCPACVFRHLSGERQQKLQEVSHLSALTRLSGRSLDDLPIRWWPSPPRDEYRDRLKASIYRTERGLFGTLSDRYGEAPIDLGHCPVQSSGSRALLHRALIALETLSTSASVLTVTTQGHPDWPEISPPPSNFSPNDVASGLIIFELEESFSPTQQRELAEMLPRLSLYDQRARLSKGSRGSEPNHFAGAKGLLALVNGRWYRGTPPAWLPQSPQSIKTLTRLILATLKLSPGEALLELGCGVGILSVELSSAGHPVHGVDHCAVAVEDARWNAAQWPDQALSFEVADGRRVVHQRLKAGDGGTSPTPAVLIHAMRKPIPNLLPLLSRLGCERVLYLAPSAPALARDLAEAPAWHLSELHFLDQTPGTAHALTGALLTHQLNPEKGS